MIKSLVIIFTIASSSALAMDCINLSGAYKTAQGIVMTISQSDCSKIIFGTPSDPKYSETRITDGAPRLRSADLSGPYFSYISSILTSNAWVETWTYLNRGDLSFFRTVSTLDEKGNLVDHMYSIPHQGEAEVDEGIQVLQRVSN